MKSIFGILFLLIALNASTALSGEESIYDACVIPETPKIPGGSVSEDELKNSVTTVKNYQIELNRFRECLDNLKVVIDEEKMDEELVEKNKIYNLKIDSIFNLSVDREQAVVDQLNAQIRRYKSKQEYPVTK